MSKKEEFLKFIEPLFEDTDNIEPNVLNYFYALRDKEEKDKPLVTDNGKKVLSFLQGAEERSFSAKEIGEELFISSRTVSGASRKLVTDGFLEKIGKDPVKYLITEKGKNFNI